MGFKCLGVVLKLRREIKKNKNLWKKKKCINLYEKHQLKILLQEQFGFPTQWKCERES